MASGTNFFSTIDPSFSFQNINHSILPRKIEDEKLKLKIKAEFEMLIGWIRARDECNCCKWITEMHVPWNGTPDNINNLERFSKFNWQRIHREARTGRAVSIHKILWLLRWIRGLLGVGKTVFPLPDRWEQIGISLNMESLVPPEFPRTFSRQFYREITVALVPVVNRAPFRCTNLSEKISTIFLNVPFNA